MEPQYHTLNVIYEITQDDPQPETYKCRPREIILRLLQDWGVIQQHLTLLETEELITTRQEDTLVISITMAGIERMQNLKKNKETA